MKKLALLVYPAVVALSLVAAATADAATYRHAVGSGYEANPPQKIVSLKTHAQVLVELQQARADGSLALFAEGSAATPVGRSTLSRADVRTQTAAARAAGYEAQYREGGDNAFAARMLPRATARTLASAKVSSAQ